MLKAAQAYFQTQVTTTSQSQLLLMLYDGAIKFLKQAKVKIEERNYAEKGILISKAIDVISELDGSLNIHKGGEIATNLHNLYFFCNTRLLQANLKMDTKLVDDVIDILSGLRDAFNQISGTVPQPAAQPAPAGRVTPTAQGAQSAAPGASGGYQPQAVPRPVASVQPPVQQPIQAQARPQAAPKAAPAPQVPKPAVAPPKAPQQPLQGVQPLPAQGTPQANKRLLGANLYRKMAQQQE